MRHRILSRLLASGLSAKLLGLGTVLLLAGCAPPQLSPDAQQLYDGAIDLWLEREARLQRVSQRVSLAAADLCPGSQTPVLGVVIVRREWLPPYLQEPARRRFEGRDGVRIVQVLPDLPAAAASVQPGDVILEIAGSRLSRPEQVYWAHRLGPGPFSIKLLRDGEPIQRQLEWRPGCDVQINLSPMQLANAFARTRSRPRLGERPLILVTYGMMRQLDRDEVLAFVIGHELGHTILLRGGGSSLSGKEGEKAADYIGAHLAVGAGYQLTPDDFDTAAQSSYANPASELADDDQRSHPTSLERELAFARTLDEIEAKIANGESLVPEVIR